MAVFKIIFTTTLFVLANCDSQIMSFELSLPDVMTTFTTIDQAFRTLQGSDIDPRGGNTLAEHLLMKVKWKVYDYMARMLNLLRRRNEMRPNVEMGPGAFKTEIVTYPPNYFVNRLKTLLKLKKKQEEREKPLHSPQ